MGKCIPCSQLARFKKLPGFLGLIRKQDSFVCTIIIKEKKRRIGATTLDVLYETIKDYQASGDKVREFSPVL